MKIESKHTAGSCSKCRGARRQLEGGIGGKGGRKKKKRSGREDWTCKLCARKWIPYNVPCQKLNPSKCKSSFSPFFCSFHCSSEGQGGRSRDRKKAIQCVFTHCVTKVLYDPALTLEGMWPHKSDEQDNILLLITQRFPTYLLYLATGILQYVLGLKYKKKCVSIQRLAVLTALRSVMKWGLTLFDLIVICGNIASA